MPAPPHRAMMDVDWQIARQTLPMNESPSVRVNVYATLRQYVGGRATLESPIEPGMDVAALLASLGVPAEKVHIVFVDRRAADLRRQLRGGEVVGVFPAVGGG